MPTSTTTRSTGPTGTNGRVAPVRRSIAALVAAPLAVLALAGCGSVSGRDEVARVGDEVLTVDMLRTVANSPAAGGPLETSAAPANLTRSVITLWVRNTVLSQEPWFGQVDADAVRAQLDAELGVGFSESDEVTKGLLIDNAITIMAVNAGLVTADDALAAITSAEVYVSPRYGRWEPSSAEVFTLAP